MESAEQPNNDLLSKVSQSLVKAGHPATPQSVNPNDESVLEPIKRDFQNWAGSTFEEKTSGESSTTNDRTTHGKVPISLMIKKRFFRKAA